MKLPKFHASKRIISIVIVLNLLVVNLLVFPSRTSAGSLTLAGLWLADSRPTQTAVTYTGAFSLASTTSIQCVQLLFSNTATGSTIPTGMSTNAATSGTINGLTGTFTTFTHTTQGTLAFSAASGSTQTAGANITFTLNGITNPNSTASNYWLQIETTGGNVSGGSCSGSVIDTKTVAWTVTSGVSMTATVDPTLTFSVAGKNSGSVNGATITAVGTTATAVGFGSVTQASNQIASQTLTVSENGTGYSVYTAYTAALTSGSNTIADVSPGTNATPALFSAAGISAFGYTTESQTLTGAAGTGTGQASRFNDGSNLNKWAAFATVATATPSAEIAHSNGPKNNDNTNIGYQVGVSGSQAAGTYTTTVILTAAATY